MFCPIQTLSTPPDTFLSTPIFVFAQANPIDGSAFGFSGLGFPNQTGGDGIAISFFGVGVTAPTTDCVASVHRGTTDANMFTLSATQNGVTSTVVWVRPKW